MLGRISCRECGNDTLWQGIRPERCQACAAWLPLLPFREAKKAWERAYCDQVLRITEGNVSQAARMAKKDRKDFHDLMRRNDIDPNAYRPPERRRPR